MKDAYARAYETPALGKLCFSHENKDWIGGGIIKWQIVLYLVSYNNSQ